MVWQPGPRRFQTGKRRGETARERDNQSRVRGKGVRRVRSRPLQAPWVSRRLPGEIVVRATVSRRDRAEPPSYRPDTAQQKKRDWQSRPYLGDAVGSPHGARVLNSAPPRTAFLRRCILICVVFIYRGESVKIAWLSSSNGPGRRTDPWAHWPE